MVYVIIYRFFVERVMETEKYQCFNEENVIHTARELDAYQMKRKIKLNPCKKHLSRHKLQSKHSPHNEKRRRAKKIKQKRNST